MGDREAVRGKIVNGEFECELGTFPLLDEGEESDLTSRNKRKRKRAQYGHADKEWFARRFAALGLSQNEADKMMGHAVGTLSKVFSGKHTLDVPMLKRLCLLLGEPMQVVAARCGY